MTDYESPWVDDHDPLCPPYLGAREGRAECAICEALEKVRADERERVLESLTTVAESERGAGMSDGYQLSRRDRVVWWLASQVLRLATPQYRAFLTVLYRLGKEEVDGRIARNGGGNG